METKNLLNKKITQWLLLLAMLVGCSANAWADHTFVSGEYIYLKNYKPSGWGSCWICDGGVAWIHIWDASGNAEDCKFSLYSGTEEAEGAIYRAIITNARTYTKMELTRNSSASTGPYNNKWNQTGNMTVHSTYNMITKADENATSYSGSYYAVAPSACTIELDPTCYTGGTGTSEDPFIVEPNSTLTFTVSATQSDPGMTGIGGSINTTSSKEKNAAATSVTITKTSSAAAGTKENWTGYAWAYENSTSYYSSSYATSDKIYTKTQVSGCTVSFGTQPSTTDKEYIKGATATALTVAASSSDGTTISYQWYKNTSASTTGATLISGATRASYTPSTAELGTLHYYCVASTTCSSGTPSSATSGFSGAHTVKGQYIIKVKKDGLFASSVPYIHAWDDGGNITDAGKWPGDVMTADGNWYTKTLLSTYSSINVIFHNNSGNQTEDITGVSENTCYLVKTTTHKKDNADRQDYEEVDCCDAPTKSGYSLSPTTFIYNGSGQAPTVSTNSGYAAPTTIKYGVNSGSATTTKPFAAGTYHVYISGPASGTTYCAYTDLDLGEYTINKANQATLSITNPLTGYNAGDVITLTVEGGTTAGTVTYTITSGSDKGSISSNKLSTTAAGNISVKATMAGNDNYYPVESEAVTFTIAAISGGTASADPTEMCQGGNASLTATDYSPVGNIIWQKSITSESAGFDDITGAESASYTAENLQQTTYFRLKLTNGGATVYSNVATVTVKPGPSLTLTGTSPKGTGVAATYPWEYMTITASCDVTPVWELTGKPAGFTEDVDYVVEGSDKVYKIKAKQTNNEDTDKFTFTVTATADNGCSTVMPFDVYINAAPAEDCGK